MGVTHRVTRLLLLLIALVAQIGFGRPVAASGESQGHARARDARIASPIVLGRSDLSDRNARLEDHTDAVSDGSAFTVPDPIGTSIRGAAMPRDRVIVDARLARPTARGPPSFEHQR